MSIVYRRNGSILVIVIVVALGGYAAWRTTRGNLPPSAAFAPRAAGPGGAPSRGGSLVGSIRSEPAGFNRYANTELVTDIVSVITQAKLVRVDRVKQDIEPWLAERWSSSPDGLEYTLQLRTGITFSDGAPFTSADVLFAFQAVYDPRTKSPLAEQVEVRGKPLEVHAPDASTVVLRFPSLFGPGLRILDNLPILPRHKLQAALDAGTLTSAWGPTTAPGEMAGLGPFVLSEYRPGERITFKRNERYWRRDARGVQLPYLDQLTLEIIADRNVEVLRLQSGQLDFTQDAVRAEDYLPLKRAADQGRLLLQDLGVTIDAPGLWFNLNAAQKATDPRARWLQSFELRKAISLAVDRNEFAKTVALGAALPVHGPVTPGNYLWYADVPGGEYDPARAKTLLSSIGLQDRNGDGLLEDARGAAARFTMLIPNSGLFAHAASVLKADLAKMGLLVDVVPLELGAFLARFLSGDYDAVYFHAIIDDTDPALSPDFWLSSGGAHVWNIGEKTPATTWEAEIDDLMHRQASTVDMRERKRLFIRVQQIMAEQLPIVYFIAPHVFVATSSRVAYSTPSLLTPQIVWNPEMLAARPPATPAD